MSDLNFESLFSDAKLDMDCPKCNSKVYFKLEDVGGTIKCTNCSTEIHLKKDDSYDKSVKSVDKSLKDLDDTLKNFGK